MRLLALTVAALVAFAANSILNRAALAEAGMDPAAFTGIRLLSGALTLGLLAGLSAGRGALVAGSWGSAAALVGYAVAFSFAYITLEAGIGALILFGAVQITMFAGSIMRGQRPGLFRWVGSGLGLAGLAVLFLPGAGAPSPAGAVLMLAAGAAWGIYSLRGQAAGDPLATTAGNFIRSAPVGLALMIPVIAAGAALPPAGIWLAIASGAVASGLGYAVWYSVLPSLEASVAAIAQLTVPLIALLGSVLLLGEALTLSFALAAALILGGVALAVLVPAPGERR